jgi:drug/metabolite transporter (DMT)-like permease
MFICFTLIYKHKKNWQGSNRGLLLARGFFGTIALYLYFITIKVLPLGTAVTIQYMSPVFSSIIGIFLLKEKVKSIQWLFFTVSFAGVLIIKGFNLHIPVTILLIGVGSAISSGFAYNFIRSMKEKEDPIVVVLHFQIFGVITGIIFSFFEWQTPIGFEWLILLLIGIFTQLGQINLTLALQEEKIADVSILNYLGVLYAIGFGMLVFGESYEFSTVIGILFIVGGVLLNYFYKKKAIIKI